MNKLRKHAPRRPRSIGIKIAGFLFTLLAVSGHFRAMPSGYADEPTASIAFRAALASGEFSRAREQIADLPRPRQQAAWSELLAAQQQAGLAPVLSQYLADADDAEQRTSSYAHSFRPQLSRVSGSRASDVAPGFSAEGLEGSSAPSDENAGAGGAAIADFDSLIDLIQTVIAPESWDTVGGPSTMFPYRAGIHVDPQGLVADVQVENADRFRVLRGRMEEGLAEATQAGRYDWTRPSPFRVVSLRRLARAWLQRRIDGNPPTQAMENLAGLCEIQFLLVLEDDLLLAAPVGGIDPTAVPWPRDQRDGRVPLGLDVLIAAAGAVADQVSFGCSIDPTEAGLMRAAEVSRQIAQRSIPTALAAQSLGEALGQQNISLIGVTPHSPLAWLMVDADRHMKQLALGSHRMPEGVLNYLNIIDQQIRQDPQQAPPGGQLLRLWFAPLAKHVRRGKDQSVYELRGRPLQLQSAKEFADARGLRTQAGDDPRGAAYAAQFNRHFLAIANRYCVYDRLRGAFELTAALELVRREVGPDRYRELTGRFIDGPALQWWNVSTPRKCASISVRHTVRLPEKRHEVYIASGGIEIIPKMMLATRSPDYPPLDAITERFSGAPRDQSRWWWDGGSGENH